MKIIVTESQFQRLMEQMISEGWDSKAVSKAHKKVNTSNKKFRAAQTAKYTDHWMNDEDKAKRAEENKPKPKGDNKKAA